MHIYIYIYTHNVCWVNYNHFKLLLWYISFVLSTLHQSWYNWLLYVRIEAPWYSLTYFTRSVGWAMKNKRKKCTANLWNLLKHPLQPKILWFFSDEKNFCRDQMVNPPNNHCLPLPGSDGEPTEQPLSSSASTRYTNSDENQTPNLHHGVWGGHIAMLCLHSSSLIISDSTQRVTLSDWRR